MRRIVGLVLIGSLIVRFLSIVGFAENVKKITLFYPSPYGEYEELRAKRIVVGGDDSGHNFIDVDDVVSPQDGVVAIEKGMVVGGYGTSADDYLKDPATTKDVKMKVLAGEGVSLVATENGDRLVYTSDGKLLLGALNTVVDECEDCKMIVGLGKKGEGNAPISFIGHRVDGGNIAWWGMGTTQRPNFSGLFDSNSAVAFVGLHDNPNVPSGVSANKAPGLYLRDESGVRAEVWIGGLKSFRGRLVPHFIAHSDLFLLAGNSSVESVGILGLEGAPVHVARELGALYDNDITDVPVTLFIQTYPPETAALGWGKGSELYGYLGFDDVVGATRIGTAKTSPYPKFCITTANVIAFLIDEEQKVTIGTTDLDDARLTVNAKSVVNETENVASFRSGDDLVMLVRKDGVDILKDDTSSVLYIDTSVLEVFKNSSSATVHIDNSGIAINGTEVRSVGGRSVALDVNGNARVNDLYVEKIGKWVSDLGGELGDCYYVYSGASHECMCADGYVLRGAGILQKSWEDENLEDDYPYCYCCKLT